MTRLRRIGLAVAILVACSRSTSAQVIAGRIVDENTGAPVVGAIVSVHDTTGRQTTLTTSDSTGAFAARVRAGSYRVRVDRLGYARIETGLFTVGTGIVRLNLSTRPQVIVLEAVGGAALNYAELIARSRTNKAVRTLLPADVDRRIERIRAENTGELLRFLVAGLSIEYTGWPKLPKVPMMWQSSSRGTSFGVSDFRSPRADDVFTRGKCDAIVAVDGIPNFWGSPETILERLVPLSRVRAIEVFNDPNFLPASLDFDGRRNPLDGPIRCGVIAIWTNEGIGVP